MSLRRFMRNRASVTRIDDTNISGTLQPKGSYVAVSGMSALECAIQQVSQTEVAMEGGVAAQGLVRLLFNIEQFPLNGEIRQGDQVTISGVVYEVQEALRRDSLERRFYGCLAIRKGGQ